MTRTISKEAREATIRWLENGRCNGEFDGFAEENMNFKEISDEEIAYYFVEWFFMDKDSDSDVDGNLIAERNKMLELDAIRTNDSSQTELFLTIYGEYGQCDFNITRNKIESVEKENNWNAEEIFKSKEAFEEYPDFPCYVGASYDDDFYETRNTIQNELEKFYLEMLFAIAQSFLSDKKDELLTKVFTSLDGESVELTLNEMAERDIARELMEYLEIEYSNDEQSEGIED